jgi:hypothetical protein
LHHNGNWYMKILTSLLFCFISVTSFAQSNLTQITPATTSSFHAEPENWLDTTNMYNSKYGAVARLTQDNMPCIMPYAAAVPIPNAAKRRTTPQEIPNFWKYKRPQNFPGKPMPLPESLQKPQSFKSPGIWKQEILGAKPIPGIENQIKFPVKDRNPKQP